MTLRGIPGDGREAVQLLADLHSQDKEPGGRRMDKSKVQVIEGKVVAEGIRIGMVASRFNEFIVGKLIDGAIDGLVRHGVPESDITANAFICSLL